MANKVRVQIILRKNDLALVQWTENGSPSRAWVTPDMIESESDNGQDAIVENPSAGIPYGVEWQYLVNLIATPQDLQRNLRAHGIWTVADLREHPDGARAALQATYGIDMVGLMNLARNSEEV